MALEINGVELLLLGGVTHRALLVAAAAGDERTESSLRLVAALFDGRYEDVISGRQHTAEDAAAGVADVLGLLLPALVQKTVSSQQTNANICTHGIHTRSRPGVCERASNAFSSSFRAGHQASGNVALSLSRSLPRLMSHSSLFYSSLFYAHGTPRMTLRQWLLRSTPR
jgi:hypothetical protein